MKPHFLLPVALLLLSVLPRVWCAEGPDAEFDRRLKEGFEVASVLENSTSEDGKVAVLFTARKKNLKAATWPVIIRDVAVSSTEVQGAEEDYAAENWIVSLPDKKRLGRVTSKQEHFMAYHGGMNHRDFSAQWGPEQEGWRFGLLQYGGKWECIDIFMVNSDGDEAKLTSLYALLERTSKKAVAAQGKKADRMVFSYELLAMDAPKGNMAVNDPLTMRVVFIAQVPKSENEDDVAEGTVTLQFDRDEKGLATATVLGVKPGRQDVAAEPAPAPATAARFDFIAFRKEWNEKAQKEGWKKVRKDLPAPQKGRKAYVQGWVEANVLQRLMHVESTNDKNKTITLYYWREGQLTSVFQARFGEDTQISEVGEATDTYNFVNEKLVGWFSTGERDAQADVKEPGVQEIGADVLQQSIKIAEPIYRAIGAD